jgi:hypothetical protein
VGLAYSLAETLNIAWGLVADEAKAPVKDRVADLAFRRQVAKTIAKRLDGVDGIDAGLVGRLLGDADFVAFVANPHDTELLARIDERGLLEELLGDDPDAERLAELGSTLVMVTEAAIVGRATPQERLLLAKVDEVSDTQVEVARLALDLHERFDTLSEEIDRTLHHRRQPADASVESTSTTMGTPTKSADEAARTVVVISYAHGQAHHDRAVAALAELLVSYGIEVVLDQWMGEQQRQLDTWFLRAVRRCDYVLAIASERYKRAAEGDAPPDDLRGAQSEALLLRNLLQGDRATWEPRILPVVLPEEEIAEIPAFLHPWISTHYRLSRIDADGAMDLLEVLGGHSPAGSASAVREDQAGSTLIIADTPVVLRSVREELERRGSGSTANTALIREPSDVQSLRHVIEQSPPRLVLSIGFGASTSPAQASVGDLVVPALAISREQPGTNPATSVRESTSIRVLREAADLAAQLRLATPRSPRPSGASDVPNVRFGDLLVGPVLLRSDQEHRAVTDRQSVAVRANLPLDWVAEALHAARRPPLLGTIIGVTDSLEPERSRDWQPYVADLLAWFSVELSKRALTIDVYDRGSVLAHLPRTSVPSATRLFRAHRTSGPGTHQVLHFSHTPRAALLQAIVPRQAEDGLVPVDDINALSVSEVSVTRDLNLVDLSSPSARFDTLELTTQDRKSHPSLRPEVITELASAGYDGWAYLSAYALGPEWSGVALLPTATGAVSGTIRQLPVAEIWPRMSSSRVSLIELIDISSG